MNRIRRALVAAIGLSPLAALAQQGMRYTELKPAQPVEDQGKILVMEFFSYDCIHCYNFEPLVEKWEKGLAKDVRFDRVAAPFNEIWRRYAGAYYTFQTLGVLARVHRPFFDLRHRDQLRFPPDKPLESLDWLNNWLTKQNIEPKRFFEVMNSFSVQTMVRRAAQLTAAYKIEGTPEMAVHGRYTVSAEQTTSREGMLQTVDFLVDKIRKGQ
jgi:thiol:disulfide interchange protein DsbA